MSVSVGLVSSLVDTRVLIVSLTRPKILGFLVQPSYFARRHSLFKSLGFPPSHNGASKRSGGERLRLQSQEGQEVSTTTATGQLILKISMENQR